MSGILFVLGNELNIAQNMVIHCSSRETQTPLSLVTSTNSSERNQRSDFTSHLRDIVSQECPGSALRSPWPRVGMLPFSSWEPWTLQRHSTNHPGANSMMPVEPHHFVVLACKSSAIKQRSAINAIWWHFRAIITVYIHYTFIHNPSGSIK